MKMLRYRLWYSLLLIAALPLTPVVAQSPIHESTLARTVPANARLFFELRDMPGFQATSTGSLVSKLLTHLLAKPDTSTQPAPGWQNQIASAIGVSDQKAVSLLFNGRVALAADSWSGLGEAVLMAEPKDVAAFEKHIAHQLIAESSQQPVRRYRLAADQELATDGQYVVLGHRETKTGLYARTIALMNDPDRACLSESTTFAERTRSLSPDSQVVFYSADTGTAGADRRRDRNSWRALPWPDIESLAVGLIVTNDGLIVDLSSETYQPLSDASPNDLPLHGFMRLPIHTIAAWTQRIDYHEWYRSVAHDSPPSTAGVLINSLTRGLDDTDINRRLLSRLRGDTIFVIGQMKLTLHPGDSPRSAPSLRLPTFSLAVETDAPDLVADTLTRVTANLLERINATPLPSEPIRAAEIPLTSSAGVIRSVPLARLMPRDPRSGLLDWMQFSWTVVDRWVLISTHPTAIDQLVRARMGDIDLLPTGTVVRALEHADELGGNPRRVMIAQPHLAANSIRAFISLIAQRHPEMLKPEWWQELRRRHRASSVQLGVIPAAKDGPGVVVYETYPNYPADQRLLPGDRIVGVDGETLDSEDPRGALRAAIAGRQNPREIKLTVIREEQSLEVVIPMPDIPALDKSMPSLQLLRTVETLLGLFHSASYVSWQPEPTIINARLELRFSDLE